MQNFIDITLAHSQHTAQLFHSLGRVLLDLRAARLIKPLHTEIHRALIKHSQKFKKIVHADPLGDETIILIEHFRIDLYFF